MVHMQGWDKVLLSMDQGTRNFIGMDNDLRDPEGLLEQAYDLTAIRCAKQPFPNLQGLIFIDTEDRVTAGSICFHGVKHGPDLGFIMGGDIGRVKKYDVLFILHSVLS